MCLVNWPEIDKEQDFRSVILTRQTFECKSKCDSHIYSASERKHRVSSHKEEAWSQGVDFVFDAGFEI